MMKDYFRDWLEQASAQAIHLDGRFGYHRKKLLGSGAFGVVYQEPAGSGAELVQKIHPITSRSLCRGRGIVPLDTVRFEDSPKHGRLVLNEDVTSDLFEKELAPLRMAVAEYHTLRALKRVDYFPQVVEQQWYSQMCNVVVADREFFLLDGRLCARTIREKVLGVDLSTLLKTEGVHPLDVVKTAYDLTQAVQIMGAKGITHRDIKPANVLYEKVITADGATMPGYGCARLIDFGTALRDNLQSPPEADLDDIVRLFSGNQDILGTPGYIAPEILLYSNGATPYADRWSLGCLLYTLMTGDIPFQNNLKAAFYTDAQKSNLYDAMKEPGIYPHAFLDAVVGLFSLEPMERLLEPVLYESANILRGNHMMNYGVVHGADISTTQVMKTNVVSMVIPSS